MKKLIFAKTIPVAPAPYSVDKKREAIKAQLRTFFPQLLPPINGSARFSVHVIFTISSNHNKRHPKTDLDNLLKPVLNAGCACFWSDDSQVDEIQAKIIRNGHIPSIKLKIFEIEEVENLQKARAPASGGAP